jgi:hypothetical protein
LLQVAEIMLTLLTTNVRPAPRSLALPDVEPAAPAEDAGEVEDGEVDDG